MSVMLCVVLTGCDVNTDVCQVPSFVALAAYRDNLVLVCLGSVLLRTDSGLGDSALCNRLLQQFHRAAT